MRRLLIITTAVVLALSAFVLPASVAGATATTFHVTTGECSGAGSILEAVALANANPGADTIVIDVPQVHLFQPILPGFV